MVHISLCCICPAVLNTRSRVPIKRYNSLTAAIFPKPKQLAEEVDPVTGAVSKAVLKDIGNLMEYAAKNPHRIPKIARRLERKAMECLERADRWGYVNVAVAGFLEMTQECEKHLSLFALHIFRLVGQLLAHRLLDFRLLAVGLLTAFWRHETGSTYMHQLDGFVPALHDLAVRPDMSSAQDIRLHAVVLAALREHVRWMARTGFLSEQLTAVVQAVLFNLRLSWDNSDGDTLSSSMRGRHADELVLEEISLESPAGVGAGAGTASHPSATLKSAKTLRALHAHVEMLMEQVAALATDAASARLVLDPILFYMEAHRWWERHTALVNRTLETVYTVFKEAERGHVLVSALVRQTATAETPAGSLAVAQRLVWLLRAHAWPSGGGGGGCAGGDGAAGATQTAKRHGNCCSLLCLNTLASEYAAHAAAHEELGDTIIETVELLAGTVEEARQIAEVMGGVLEKSASETHGVVLAKLDCLSAVVRVAAMNNSAAVCFVGHPFPQGLLLGLLPLLAHPNDAICLKAHQMLRALFRRDGTVLPSRLSLSRQESDRERAAARRGSLIAASKGGDGSAGVLSDKQAALLLSTIAERLVAPSPATAELAGAMLHTFHTAVRHCDRAGATLLAAVPLAFRLQALSEVEQEQDRCKSPSLLAAMSTSMLASVGMVWCGELVSFADQQAKAWGAAEGQWSANIDHLLQAAPSAGWRVTAYTSAAVVAALSRNPSLSPGYGGARQLRLELQKPYNPLPLMERRRLATSDANGFHRELLNGGSSPGAVARTSSESSGSMGVTRKVADGVPSAWELMQSIRRDDPLAGADAAVRTTPAADAPAYGTMSGAMRPQKSDAAAKLIAKLASPALAVKVH